MINYSQVTLYLRFYSIINVSCTSARIMAAGGCKHNLGISRINEEGRGIVHPLSQVPPGSRLGWHAGGWWFDPRPRQTKEVKI